MACAELGGVDWEWQAADDAMGRAPLGDLIGRNPTDRGKRGVESSQRLGGHRWVVERTFAWLSRFRRLAVRYERRVDLHLGGTWLGCSLICFRFLPA